jgi:hypothetical protein
MACCCQAECIENPQTPIRATAAKANKASRMNFSDNPVRIALPQEYEGIPTVQAARIFAGRRSFARWNIDKFTIQPLQND